MSEVNARVRDWVGDYFGQRDGVLWELGAFDGINDSITRPLLTRQGNVWTGVLVEGNSVNAAKLRANYEGQTNVTIIETILSPNGGIVTWWDDGGDQESTIMQSHLGSGLAHPKADGKKREYIKTSKPSTALTEFVRRWNVAPTRPLMLMVDLEGFSEAAAAELVRLGCAPEILVLETLSQYAIPGYSEVFRSTPDVVYRRR